MHTLSILYSGIIRKKYHRFSIEYGYMIVGRLSESIRSNVNVARIMDAFQESTVRCKSLFILTDEVCTTLRKHGPERNLRGF